MPSDEVEPIQQAAAFHGLAINQAIPPKDRIAAAYQALDLYAAEVEALIVAREALEAELERQRPVIKAARAWRGQPWLTHGASRSVKFTSALAAAVDDLDGAPGEATP